MNDRIRVESNGQQAPYGDNELIADYATTPAGMRKAAVTAASWYTPATIRVNGEIIDDRA